MCMLKREPLVPFFIARANKVWHENLQSYRYRIENSFGYNQLCFKLWQEKAFQHRESIRCLRSSNFKHKEITSDT